MSDAPTPTQRQDEILTELADMGMAIARDLHRRALAAKDVATACELSLAFHRASRSIRQTLALEARLHRERRLVAQETDRKAREERLDRVQKKRDQVRKALTHEIWTEYEGDEAEALLDELGAWVMEESGEDGFLDTPIEVCIARIREGLGLPTTDPASEGLTGPTVVVLDSSG
jgi:hypothetical protein